QSVRDLAQSLAAAARSPAFREHFEADGPAPAAEEAEGAALPDTLVAALGAVVSVRDERARGVIAQRLGFEGEPLTLQEVGEALGVGRERARQIEKRALDRARRAGLGRATVTRLGALLEGRE